MQVGKYPLVYILEGIPSITLAQILMYAQQRHNHAQQLHTVTLAETLHSQQREDVLLGNNNIDLGKINKMLPLYVTTQPRLPFIFAPTGNIFLLGLESTTYFGTLGLFINAYIIGPRIVSPWTRFLSVRGILIDSGHLIQGFDFISHLHNSLQTNPRISYNTQCMVRNCFLLLTRLQHDENNSRRLQGLSISTSSGGQDFNSREGKMPHKKTNN